MPALPVASKSGGKDGLLYKFSHVRGHSPGPGRKQVRKWPWELSSFLAPGRQVRLYSDLEGPLCTVAAEQAQVPLCMCDGERTGLRMAVHVDDLGAHGVGKVSLFCQTKGGPCLGYNFSISNGVRKKKNIPVVRMM